MEIIFEAIFELILELLSAMINSKRLPKFARILIAFVLWGGICGGFTFLAVIAREHLIGFILLGILALCFFVALVISVYKIIKV